MTKSKVLAIILAVIMVISILPISVYAADPEIHEIDGERTVFLGSFGKVSYNGKSYVSFKNFNDAWHAIGKDGGRIVLSGNISAADFADIKGRGPVTIVGVGKNSAGNLISFPGLSTIVFEGDVSLGNVNIRTDAGAYIYTNGYSFNSLNDFDTYHKENWQGAGVDSIITYIDSPSVSVGNVQTDASVNLTAGTYDVVAAGSVNGLNVKSNTNIILDGANAVTAVAGNVGNGTLTGNTKLALNDGAVTKLIAGSDGGTVSGNVFCEINGGKIDEFVIGNTAGATVNGSLVVAVNGGEIGKISTSNGTITGKKIIIVSPDVSVDIPTEGADYIITINGGLCEPIFSGSSVSGFRITDSYGIPVTSATINGSKISAADSKFNLASGKNNIVVESGLTVSINKNANYVAGYEDGTFRPQNNMTKAEAVTLLSRLIVDENLIKGVITTSFADTKGHWAESYVGFFEKLGYLDLVTEDFGLKFVPDKQITRGEFTELIYKLAYEETSDPSVKLRYFSDVDSNANKFAPAINYAVSTNIVNGYDDNTFRPDNNITRAEVVTMVNRMLGRIPNGVAGENNFGDISGHWAAPQVLASCNPENVSWTTKTEENKYVLEGTTAETYVKGLYNQSNSLSSEAIRDGIEVISEQMKKDILNAPDKVLEEKGTKRVYYISEKNGNDDNDGLTPETAFKSVAGLSKIRFMRNVVVLFERGGVYRGTYSTASNSYYGAYGEGPKPLLVQSRRNFADESLWVETEYENVWKCTELFNNVGVIGFDHDLFDYSETCYDETYGWIMNKNLFDFNGVEDMNKDLQFYNEIPEEGLGYSGPLYIYSTEGNPGKRFNSIEIGENIHIFKGEATNVIIENLAFKFTGAHAISVSTATNYTVRNCVFSWVGGSLLSLNFRDSGPCNYGNAIEAGSCNGFYLDNNWMYQIYDTALTHQRSGGVAGSVIQKNIRYSGNLAEYCHWSIEYYNNPAGKNANDIRSTSDQYYAYNVCRLNGFGWGSITRYRTDSSQLYHGSSFGTTKNMLTEYNIYDRSAGYLLNLCADINEVEDKNIYVQHEGSMLGYLRTQYQRMDKNAAYNIAKLWKDVNAVVILVDPEKEPLDSLMK